MPLARIITPVPEYSAGLAQDLRSLGFEVQTCAPGLAARDSADLEITVGLCDPDDAAKLIGDVSTKKDMCVFVGPQAASGKIRSIEMFVVKPKRQVVQGTVTPAQVIEISSALLRSRKPKMVEPVPLPRHRARWEAIGQGAKAAKKDILLTTRAWLNGARSTGQMLAVILEEYWEVVGEFFVEVEQETARLGRRLASMVRRAAWRLSTRQRQDDDSDLVPSLFNLFPQDEEQDKSPEADGEWKPVISQWKPLISRMVDLKRILLGKFMAPDPRFLRAAAPAALVAVTILMGILMSQRRPSLPPDAMATSPYEKPRVRFEHAVSKTDMTATGSKSSVLSPDQVRPAALVASSTAETRPKPRQRTLSGEDESFTDEVIVRHLTQPSHKSAPEQRHEIRRYSDLN
jgi:hypothetical protein